MLYRKIGNKIRQYLISDTAEIMLVNGARQVGKSYIIRHVCQEVSPDFLEINFEEDKRGLGLFADVKTVEDFYIALSVYSPRVGAKNKYRVVFIDEIQVYEQFFTLLKFLREDGRYKYIVSGSLLGVTLKMTSSVPVGSLQILEMYPLDFEEFLLACSVQKEGIDAFRKSFSQYQSLSEGIHNKLLDLFKKYLIVGGLPAAVNSFITDLDIAKVRKIQQDILFLYKTDASKYEAENSKKLSIRRIYEMLPSTLENKKKRMRFSEIEGKSWKRFDDYKDEFEYLISAGIALNIQAISTPIFPMSETVGKNLLKLYLNDIGLLSGLYYGNQIEPILKDSRSINLGTVYETVVAQELKAHGFQLYYYDNKKNGEVNFIIDDVQNLSTLPIEVKSGRDYTIHSALNRFVSNKDYGIKRGIVLSNNREVREKEGIVYLPIYFVMFLEKNEVETAVIPALDTDFSELY